jgi:hypothetical protein
MQAYARSILAGEPLTGWKPVSGQTKEQRVSTVPQPDHSTPSSAATHLGAYDVLGAVATVITDKLAADWSEPLAVRDAFYGLRPKENSTTFDWRFVRSFDRYLEAVSYLHGLGLTFPDPTRED